MVIESAVALDCLTVLVESVVVTTEIAMMSSTQSQYQGHDVSLSSGRYDIGFPPVNAVKI